MRIFPNGPQTQSVARPDGTLRLSPESLIEQIAYIKALGIPIAEAGRHITRLTAGTDLVRREELAAAIGMLTEEQDTQSYFTM